MCERCGYPDHFGEKPAEPTTPREEMEAALKKAERCGCSNCRKVFTVKMRTLVPQILAEMTRTEERLGGAKKLQDLTLNNELRWMRKHEELSGLIASVRDWKSPDGVLQIRDLNWFKGLWPQCAHGNFVGYCAACAGEEVAR